MMDGGEDGKTQKREGNSSLMGEAKIRRRIGIQGEMGEMGHLTGQERRKEESNYRGGSLQREDDEGSGGKVRRSLKGMNQMERTRKAGSQGEGELERQEMN